MNVSFDIIVAIVFKEHSRDGRGAPLCHPGEMFLTGEQEIQVAMVMD